MGMWVFVGEGSGGEGELWVSGGVGWKVGKWCVRAWWEKRFGVNSNPFKTGGKMILFGFLALVTETALYFSGLRHASRFCQSQGCGFLLGKVVEVRGSRGLENRERWCLQVGGK
nr:hypothetical protein [Tanacetum cinerariifolium]